LGREQPEGRIYGADPSTSVWLLQNLFVEDMAMLRKLLSRRHLVLISLGLLILAAMTVVLAYKGVLAATLNGDEGDQRKDVFYNSQSLEHPSGMVLWTLVPRYEIASTRETV
jgi:hypothetical protein